MMKKYIVCAGMIITNSNLAAIALGESLQNDQNIFLKACVKNLIGLGRDGLSSAIGFGATNDAKDPANFFGPSCSVVEIFLSAEHQSHVETRLA